MDWRYSRFDLKVVWNIVLWSNVFSHISENFQEIYLYLWSVYYWPWVLGGKKWPYTEKLKILNIYKQQNTIIYIKF